MHSSSKTFTPTSGVYALIDPRTDRVMYVGQSIDIDYRFRQHLDLRYGPWSKKFEWVRQLSIQGLTPKLLILKQCKVKEMDGIEQDLIAHYHAIGQCDLNQKSLGTGNSNIKKVGHSSRDDWFQLGRKCRYATKLLTEIAHEAGKLCGIKMGDRVTRLRARFICISVDLQDAIRSKFGFDRELLDAFKDREDEEPPP